MASQTASKANANAPNNMHIDRLFIIAKLPPYLMVKVVSVKWKKDKQSYMLIELSVCYGARSIQFCFLRTSLILSHIFNFVKYYCKDKIFKYIIGGLKIGKRRRYSFRNTQGN